MDLEQVEQGILNYLKREIADKADGILKFVIYTGMNMPNFRIRPIIESYRDNELVKLSGIFSDENHIDINKLYQAAKQAMQQCHHVEYMGIKFNSEDVDKLYHYITGA